MITLTTININDPVNDGPSQLNGNFNTIKSHIDDLEALLDAGTNKLRLTSLTTIADDSIEAAAITLTGNTGNVFILNPAGGGVIASLSSTGDLTVRKIVAAGTGSNKSEFGDIDVAGESGFTGGMTVKGKLFLNQANTQVVRKSRVLALTDANMGSGATTAVDISKDDILHLDYDNSGNALGDNAEIKLDLTSMEIGQVVRMHCYRINATGMRFYNGTGGAEVFAYIDPNAGGYTSIAASSKPEFAPSSTPNNQSWIEVQLVDIGGGNLRLVVLDSLLVNNVV